MLLKWKKYGDDLWFWIHFSVVFHVLFTFGRASRCNFLFNVKDGMRREKKSCLHGFNGNFPQFILIWIHFNEKKECILQVVSTILKNKQKEWNAKKMYKTLTIGAIFAIVVEKYVVRLEFNWLIRLAIQYKQTDRVIHTKNVKYLCYILKCTQISNTNGMNQIKDKNLFISMSNR